MSEFWKNISRYPRFFISSLVGSILVILTPLKSLSKIPKFQALVIIGFFISMIVVCLVILKMTGF